MKEFLIYISCSAACIGFFSFVYYFFLRKLTCFGFNRVFLLVGLFISFVLPAIHLSYDVEVSPITISVVGDGVEQTAETTSSDFVSVFWLILFCVYLSGALVMLIRSLTVIKEMRRLENKGKSLKNNGCRIVENSEVGVPFTVFNFIYINSSKLQTKEKDIILKHEISHIKQKHWIDLLCGECALMLQWFNPLLWFYVHLMKENHEFLADRAVLSDGTSNAVYNAVLINQQFGGTVFSFANSFNYSTNKNRFEMMKKSKTKSWKKIAALAVLPFVGVFMMLSAKPNYVTVADDKPAKVSVKVVGYGYKDSIGGDPLVIIGGKEVALEVLKNKPADEIESISVIKDASAIEKYGEKGKNGVIVVTIKGDSAQTHAIDFDNIVGQAEVININLSEKKRVKELVVVDGEKVVYTAPAGDTTPASKAIDKEFDIDRPDSSKISVKVVGVRNDTEKIIVNMNKKAVLSNALVIVDDKEVPYGDLQKISSDQIESIEVYKEKQAIEKYGDKGKYGVVLVTTKKK